MRDCWMRIARNDYEGRRKGRPLTFFDLYVRGNRACMEFCCKFCCRLRVDTEEGCGIMEIYRY